MDYFPLFAKLKNQPCLVVGGGEVAVRKARELIEAGARVSVVAPDACPALRTLAERGALNWRQGRFEDADIGPHLLVVAATGDATTNRAVATAAAAAQRFCNVVDDAAASSFIVPGIVDRSPVIVAVSSGGQSPVLARMLRQHIERWLPAQLGALAGWAAGWRERARAALPDIGQRRAFLERLLSERPAAAFLAGNQPSADTAAAALLAGDGAHSGGHAWLVGAGPGDPGLITLRGLQALEQADVVLHDRLVAPELLRSARREAEIIAVGKIGGGPSTRQEDINRLLVENVRAGRRVCRLKGGDPFIFGRGGEEALALAEAGLSFEVIPGVTAASGCGAAAGIPLTHRGLATAVTLVTAQGADSHPPDWSRLAQPGHTLAIYMGGRQVAEIAGELVRHGRAATTGAAIIINGTGAAQRVIRGTLADIGTRHAVQPLAPALMIVGDTVPLAETLSAVRGAGLAAPGVGPVSFVPAVFPHR